MSPRISPSLVLDAVRKAQKRTKGPVSAKDILFELTGGTRFEKNKRADARIISAILCRSKIKDEIIRIKDNATVTKYQIKERKDGRRK